LCDHVGKIQYCEESLIRMSTRWVGFSVKRLLSIGEEIAVMDSEQKISLIDNRVLCEAMRRIQGRRGKLPESTKCLDDLYFNEDLKQNTQNIAYRMKNALMIEELGGSVPNGLLFHGPAGTGKTETARALAKASGYAFLSTTSNELCRSSDAIDLLIREASDIRPCIVFIDEADDILANRQYSNVSTITNKLLTVMDGSDGKIPDVLFIAATNHPENIDPAALRGGRFTEKLNFAYPNKNVRAEFANNWMLNSNAKFCSELNGEKLALLIGDNVSIANVAAILQESVNQMLRISNLDGTQRVQPKDVEMAIQIIRPT